MQADIQSARIQNQAVSKMRSTYANKWTIQDAPTMPSVTTVRPKTGAWIVPANEAKGKFIHTELGIKYIASIHGIGKLRPDQLEGVPKIKKLHL